MKKRNISKTVKLKLRKTVDIIVIAITNEIGDIFDVYQGIPLLFNIIKRTVKQRN